MPRSDGVLWDRRGMISATCVCAHKPFRVCAVLGRVVALDCFSA